jgi:hypothetical protein
MWASTKPEARFRKHAILLFQVAFAPDFFREVSVDAAMMAN